MNHYVTIASNVPARALQRWRLAVHRNTKINIAPVAGSALGSYEQAKIDVIVSRAIERALDEWPACGELSATPVPAARSVSLIAPSAQTAGQGRARGPAKSFAGSSSRTAKQTKRSRSTR